MSYQIDMSPQRSPEWFTARLGRLTGSVAGDMLATVKNGEAAARRNLRIKLVLERLTGQSQERGFVSPAMQHGIDTEAEAKAAYEAITGELVENTGFVYYDHLMAGCSLDGCVMDGPVIVAIQEFKCPQPATHLGYLRTGIIPPDYLAQITHNLWVTGAKYCDWMSYCPSFPEPLRAKRVRVEWDGPTIEAYGLKAVAFLEEVDRELDELKRMVA
jgi:predicted phage-related endonuclease